MSKKKGKWESVADLIWKAPTTIEGVFVAIPYFILNSIGTFFKVILLSLISVLSLNKWIKLRELWSKKYFKENIVEPWNCVLAIFIIVIVSFIF
ncbi:MAG: hypothetical protein NWQ38_04895 [Cellulophaga sp.]|nr:hypothetical protein [Cellulophaga sp.]